MSKSDDKTSPKYRKIMVYIDCKINPKSSRRATGLCWMLSWNQTTYLFKSTPIKMIQSKSKYFQRTHKTFYNNLFQSDTNPTFISQLFIELNNYIPFFFADLFDEEANLNKMPPLVQNNPHFQNYRKNTYLIQNLSKNLIKNIPPLKNCKNDSKNSRLFLKSLQNSNNPTLLFSNFIKSTIITLNTSSQFNAVHKALSKFYEINEYETDPLAHIIFSLLDNFGTPLYFKRTVSKNTTGQFFTSFTYHFDTKWLEANQALEWPIELLVNPNIFHSTRTPMIHRPNNWNDEDDGPYSGGYLLNQHIQLNWTKESAQSDQTMDGMVGIYQIWDNLNWLNQKPYQVNTKLLQILNTNKSLLNTKEQKLLTIFNNLTAPFYFQHQVDFRCRIYPCEYRFHPMDSPFQKALIEFNTATPLTDLNPLKHYTSALFLGTNRGYSNNELLEKFEKEIKNMLKLDLTSENIQKIFQKYGKCWSLIRLIIEWQQIFAQKDLKNYLTNIILYFDCTASAFQ